MRQGKVLCEEAGNPLVAIFAILTSAPTGREVMAMLANGNLGVYADIYWQHLAYAEGGIEEMKRLFDDGELREDLYKAWLLIDQGKVWEGNRLLLMYEQKVTLQRQVYDLHPDACEYLSGYVVSPIPGDDISLHDCVPGGNLADFDDRWKWIDTCMLPAWRKFHEEQQGRASEIMNEYLKGRFRD